MTCKFIKTKKGYAIQCTMGANAKAKMKLKAGKLIGYCDMEPQIFKVLKSDAIVTIYDDGAGPWGDYQGSWRKKFQRKYLELVEER